MHFFWFFIEEPLDIHDIPMAYDQWPPRSRWRLVLRWLHLLSAHGVSGLPQRSPKWIMLCMLCMMLYDGECIYCISTYVYMYIDIQIYIYIYIYAHMILYNVNALISGFFMSFLNPWAVWLGNISVADEVTGGWVGGWVGDIMDCKMITRHQRSWWFTMISHFGLLGAQFLTNPRFVH